MRHLKLTSKEIMFQRDQQSDQNIHLSDSSLAVKSKELGDKNNQYSVKSKSKAFSKPSEQVRFGIGSLVHFKDEKDKGSTRELYIVVGGEEPNKTRVKKQLHL